MNHGESVAVHVDSAGALHALAMPTGEQPQLWVMRPTAPALVMGSAQRPDAFDQAGLAAAGIDLAPRRSGGGAVFIRPPGVVWIDVLAPRGSDYWRDDLVDTFMVVGEAWQLAFADLGIDAHLVDHKAEPSDAARLACWAGLGWGELTVGGVKIVGLSQRRTRWGARVQAMAVIDGSSADVVDWFADPDTGVLDRAALRASIGSRPVPVDARELEDAVLHRLRALS